MTFLQNTLSTLSTQGLCSSWSTALQPVNVTLDNSTQYNDETAAKILAAKRGKRANAPRDPDAFLEWLTA